MSAEHLCTLVPNDYWALRDDNAFEAYVAECDGNRHSVLSLDEDADGLITRVSKVTALKNPIPSSFRSMLGCGDEFSFKITESWRREAHDAATPMRFTTEPAVLPSKIAVHGAQWVESRPDGKAGSLLKFQLSVKVRPAAPLCRKHTVPAGKRRDPYRTPSLTGAHHGRGWRHRQGHLRRHARRLPGAEALRRHPHASAPPLTP